MIEVLAADPYKTLPTSRTFSDILPCNNLIAESMRTETNMMINLLRKR